MDFEADFLVIGSGLAGLTYALSVAPYGRVALLTKKNKTDANSSWAQGGIAGVLGDNDSFELHKQDTIVAGAGLCREEAVDILVHEGPERIRDLIALGASFNTVTDETGKEVLSLGREGGHSRNRIVHTADFTGWECERTLLDAVKRTPNIAVHEHFFVTDLLLSHSDSGVSCLGALAIDNEDNEVGRVARFRARATFLATGGCGQVFQHTTNPEVATGDGIAIAWRAGAAISNMEFIQYHPTTLYHPSARAFLITEALRGEGGILRRPSGETFMERYHPLGALAPRDIVARAIVSEMNRCNAPCVYLDVTHLDPEFLKSHFPTVYERCLSVGVDITREPIPIVPAQHYQCGGVATDMNGRTNIDRLYAAGEAACTGVHGANRLASNSLLEAMVFGHRSAAHAIEHAVGPIRGNELAAPDKDQRSAMGSETATSIRDLVRGRMQRSVGVVRSVSELEQLEDELSALEERVEEMRPASAEQWETLNVVQTAGLIVRSALKRRESRGLHYVTDYPNPVESERHDTILLRHDPHTTGEGSRA